MATAKETPSEVFDTPITELKTGDYFMYADGCYAIKITGTGKEAVVVARHDNDASRLTGCKMYTDRSSLMVRKLPKGTKLEITV